MILPPQDMNCLLQETKKFSVFSTRKIPISSNIYYCMDKYKCGAGANDSIIVNPKMVNTVILNIYLKTC